MKRRAFVRIHAVAAAGILLHPAPGKGLDRTTGRIRLGGPVFGQYSNPDEWALAVKKAGFSAAYCPLKPEAGDDLVEHYRKAALQNGIIISEVGAWSNPISPDATTAAAAIQKCINSLALADRIGASCCVNISGSRNEKHWAGPHPANLTPDTFDLIVETVRKIIDAVKPVRTWYTLEAMPWTYPDSADSYLKLIKAIDRKQFAVHFDPVNLVVSPQVLYSNGEMIRDAFHKLGRWIKSCHAKDVTIREDTYLPQLDEVRPGMGLLDYRTFLKELAGLDNVPLMLEHLKTEEEYALAAGHIKQVAAGLSLST